MRQQRLSRATPAGPGLQQRGTIKPLTAARAGTEIRDPVSESTHREMILNRIQVYSSEERSRVILPLRNTLLKSNPWLARKSMLEL